MSVHECHAAGYGPCVAPCCPVRGATRIPAGCPSVHVTIEEKPVPEIDLSEPRVLVIDPSPYHLREYDFKRGDQRSFTQEEALEVAQRRVRDRGCRQQVRRVRLQPGDKLTPNWLIQDI